MKNREDYFCLDTRLAMHARTPGGPQVEAQLAVNNAGYKCWQQKMPHHDIANVVCRRALIL